MLGWGRRQRRDLPWRDSRDPWAILVAEVMLQQTQVERVLPRWSEFLRRWPSPAVCAAAPLSDVLHAWHGLGYPRRGRNLWLTAEACVRRFDGALPDELVELLSLPGIGPYTARAVLVFAHERPVGVVDTNIARILARLGGTRLTPRQAQELADRLVSRRAPWAWNQSLMDVGALICRPTPRCERCPLEPWCEWRRRGNLPEDDPAGGSAFVSSAQPRFEGSDRQRRGRVLAMLRDGPQQRDQVVAECAAADVHLSRPAARNRIELLLAGLIDEGLVSVEADSAGAQLRLG